MQALRSILLGICVVSLGIEVSCISTLKQGDNLNSSSQLDSPNGLFTLRFYTPDNQHTNSSYIAVIFNRGEVAPIQIPAVWIGNRDDPLPSNSTPLLTLGAGGELAITRPGEGGDPIQLYAGGSQPSNITATLLDTGNFVVQNMSSNGQVLWQSYDHPTDTLLSGMKLGVNNKISSWLTPSNPASGPFTLEWDPSVAELLIRRRGMVYWRSGQLKDYYSEYWENVKNFENFNFNPDPFNFNYNSTNEGDYFMYTVIQVAGLTPDSRKAISGWRLDWTGNISTIDDRGIILAMASVCYGYNSDGFDTYSSGCELWEQPKCRNKHQVFDRRSGFFRNANTTPVAPNLEFNSSLSLSDCRDACWNWKNCECAGYSNILGQDYGCSYWIGKDLEWVQDNEGSTERRYVLLSSEKGWFAYLMIFFNQIQLKNLIFELSIAGNKKKNYVGIILGVVSAVLLLMLTLVYLIVRNRKGEHANHHHIFITLKSSQFLCYIWMIISEKGARITTTPDTRWIHRKLRARKQRTQYSTS